MKKNKVFKRIKSNKDTVNKLSDNVQYIVKKRHINLQEIVLNRENNNSLEPDYSSIKFLRLYKGYDFLENQIFIRHFLMKKYKLQRTLYLDVLLFLFPKNLFTIKDFIKIRPFRFTLVNIKKLIEWGLIDMVVYNKNPYERLYRCSLKTKEIIELYYKMCSGEILIPEDDICLISSGIKGDKIKNDLIKSLNKEKTSKTKKNFFSLYKKNPT